MFNTSIETNDRLFENTLYRQSHINVTGVHINRDFDSSVVRIVFRIENVKRTRIIEDVQCIPNEDIIYYRLENSTYRLENIIYRANKIANVINEVPTHIPDEQIAKWINLRMEKL